MANPTGKDVAVKVDAIAAGSLVDLTTHLNSASLTAAQSILEDTALGDDEKTYVHGLAGASMSINGFYNTTVEAVFGPYVGNRTGVASVTAQYQAYTINSTAERIYRGEALVSNIQVSGAPDTLETFSADMTFTGVLTRTSIAL